MFLFFFFFLFYTYITARAHAHTAARGAANTRYSVIVLFVGPRAVYVQAGGRASSPVSMDRYVHLLSPRDSPSVERVECFPSLSRHLADSIAYRDKRFIADIAR